LGAVAPGQKAGKPPSTIFSLFSSENIGCRPMSHALGLISIPTKGFIFTGLLATMSASLRMADDQQGCDF